MRRLTLLLLLSLLTMVACTEDQAAKEPPVNGSAAPAQLPPQNELTDALQKEYWVFEFMVHPYDVDISRFNRGRWYDFHADGTYTGGHWQEQNDSGNWFYRGTPQQTFVVVDSDANDLNDAEWEIQGSTYDYTAMSWVRTGKLGDQVKFHGKLLRLTTPPTKASLGVE